MLPVSAVSDSVLTAGSGSGVAWTGSRQVAGEDLQGTPPCWGCRQGRRERCFWGFRRPQIGRMGNWMAGIQKADWDPDHLQKAE